MIEILDTILVIVLVLNLFALGTSRILSAINIVAIQGTLLGILPLLGHKHLSIPIILASIGAILLKGLIIPLIMRRSLRDVNMKREVEPMIPLLITVLIGAGATGLLLLLSRLKNIPDSQSSSLIIPASVATIFCGFIMLITRFKALSQVLGYLVLENGIFIFGLLLLEALPLIVELGVLLDLFVGIFVISIITNHINEAFSSLDTRNLDSLKEE
jgi:hydrogenase-4 component E